MPIFKLCSQLTQIHGSPPPRTRLGAVRGLPSSVDDIVSAPDCSPIKPVIVAVAVAADVSRKLNRDEPRRCWHCLPSSPT